MAVTKNARLSDADRRKIYKLYKQHQHTKKELAETFNCSLNVVKALIANFDSPLHQQRLAAKKAGEAQPLQLPNERWKPITYPTKTLYEVSNLGRIRSYFNNAETPIISNGVLQMGYLFLDYHNTKEARRIKAGFHIIVADHFVQKPGANHSKVIHLDHVKSNNRSSNLKWVTYEQFIAHQAKNPNLAAARAVINTHRKRGAKLTLAQVEKIRKMLADPRRKLTKEQIAAMFNTTHMTIYRIQSGENWGNKGNHIPYERKEAAKLSDKTIREIRKKLAKKNAMQVTIAREYGVSTTIINRIKKGLTYKSV